MLAFFKKRGKLFIILAIVLLVAAGGVLGYFQWKKFKADIAERDQKIAQLEQTITTIGDLVTAYVVRADVPAGKEITETDLQPVDMSSAMAGSMVTNLNDAKGKYYKIGLTKGSPLTKDMVMETQIDDSMRKYDIITDENPLGIRPGSYVDIRISMPFGEDFIAMPHKRVEGINSGILKLAINEQDIHIYNSMLVDKIIYPGTRIYAVEYLEPGAQKPATNYYPISKNILAIAEKDPNLLSAIKQDMISRRDQLEASLKSAADPEIARILERGKQDITNAISASDKEIQKRWEKEAKEQAKGQNGVVD